MVYSQTIFTEAPKTYQLYPRNSQNTAMVRLEGSVHTADQDSLMVEVFKNGSLWHRQSNKLFYEAGKAVFSEQVAIQAELSNYRFRVFTRSGNTSTMVLHADSVVCGDVYLLQGQSNTVANSGGALTYQNPWLRSFGTSSTDTAACRNNLNWGLAQQKTHYSQHAVGVWGHKVGDMIIKNYQVPVCIINGAVIGTKISLHLPNLSNAENLATIYGRLLYRARKAGVAGSVRAILWYQGESDTHATLWAGYYNDFKKLYAAWQKDFNNPSKVYVCQVRPGCDKNATHSDLREQQRQVTSIAPGVIQLMSTSWVPGFNGCHYNIGGYTQLGVALYRMVARDFYGSSDIQNITPPNLKNAFFTSSSNDEVALVFDQPVVWGADTLGHQLKDYFYFNNTAKMVSSWTVSNDTVKLKLTSPVTSTTKVGYLPPFDYLGTTAFYQGPWLKNIRGIGALAFAQVPINANAAENFYISAHPSNSTICAGANTLFSVAAVGNNLTYQWQLSTDGGATWSNLANAGVYSNVNKPGMNITAATQNMNNSRFRCAISNGSSTLYSNVALLTVNFAPMMVTHPSAVAVNAGQNASFSASATGAGLSYQWQLSTDGGTTWGNIANGGVYSNATAATLNITGATASMNQYRYRAMVSGLCAPVAYSNAAVLTVNSATLIVSHPQNVSVSAGTAVAFSVSATGSNLTYQWQLSTNGGTGWGELSNGGLYSNVTAATMNISSVSGAMNNYQYRCMVTGTGSPALTSNAAILQVSAATEITQQPENKMVVANGNTSFSVTANGSSLTYQWQLSTNGGTGWADLSNSGVYSNVTAATMNITAASVSMNNYQYRCMVTGTGFPALTSNAATLQVGTAPEITQQPVNKTVVANSSTSFAVAATGSGLSYQWQLSTDTGVTWSNLIANEVYSQVTTPTLQISSAGMNMNQHQFRCVVSGTYAPVATSAAATLTVESAPVISLQPVDVTVMEGARTTFSIEATGTQLTYQWQFSTNGTAWNNLANNATYTGVTTDKLSVSAVTMLMNGHRFRCVVSGKHEPSVTSQAAMLGITVISSTFATGDYMSSSSGTWGSAGTADWMRFNMPNSGWNASAAPAANTSNHVYIAGGHTITTNASIGNSAKIIVMESGVFNLNNASTLLDVTVKTGGKMNVNQALTMRTEGTLKVEDGATLVLEHDFMNPATMIWNGAEYFAPASHLFIQHWKVTSTHHLPLFSGEVTANTFNGYSAAFGHLYINISRVLPLEWEMLGNGANHKNLCHGNLEFIQAGGKDIRLAAGRLATEVTSGIGGDLIINEQWGAARNAMLAVGTANVDFTVKGDVIINGEGGFNIHASNSNTGKSELTVNGDIIVNKGKFLLNRVTFWSTNALYTVLNVKGNILVKAEGLLQNFAPVEQVKMNIAGQGVQEINCASSVRSIPMFIKAGVTLKLKQNNLMLNTKSAITVEQGGSIDFGFNDTNTAALFIGNSSGTTSFALEAGGSMRITAPEGIETDSRGNVRTITRSFSEAGNYIYAGRGQQMTGRALPSKVAQLHIDKPNASEVVIVNFLPSTLQVTQRLHLKRGRLMLDTRVLEIGTMQANGAIIQSAQPQESYIISDAAGVVKHYVNQLNVPYFFPIGDDFEEYTPCTINLTQSESVGSGAYLSATVVDKQLTNMPAGANTYLTRYWEIDADGLGVNYAFSISFTHLSGDKTGSANLVPVRSNASGWQKAMAGAFSVSSNTITWNGANSLGNYTAFNDVNAISSGAPGTAAGQADTWDRLQANSSMAAAREEQPEISNVVLELYPNPTADKCTLTMSNEYYGNLSVALYDMSGKVLEKINLDKQSATLETAFEMAHLKNGSYLIEIRSDKERILRRIIKH